MYNDPMQQRSGSGRSGRGVGRFMIAVGAVGAVVGLAGAVIGVTLISSMRSSIDDSLALTSETLDTAADSITLSASIVETLRLSIDSVGAAVTAVQTSVDDSATALDDVGTFLSGSLSDALESTNAVLPTLATTAGAIDDALRLLSELPVGPDYDPEQPFDETITSLADALAPLPEQLQLLDADMTALQTSATDVSTRLTNVIADIAALTERLDSIDELLDRYAAAAATARTLATESRSDLDRNATLGVVLAIMIGGLIVASQVVPLWLGRRLVDGRLPG